MWHRVIFALRGADLSEPELTRDLDAPPAAPDGAVVRNEPNLRQWFVAVPDAVTATYVFDDEYLVAHPEAVEARHLRLLHALLAFKLFDEGDLIAPPPMLAGALRWPSIDTPRAALGA